MDRWSKFQPANTSPDESTSSSSAGSCWTEKQPAEELSDMSSSSSAGGTRYSFKSFRRKKKPAPRRADPGRRYRGGRVYDTALGITCHFCRQKTTDKHVICCGRTCVLAFCGSCLRNRHGEDVKIETADEDNVWICPKCRGGCGRSCKNCCTCSFCRQKQHLKPPKISNAEMQAQGFDNVHDYLIYLETGESPESISARKLGKNWCCTLKSMSNLHKRRKLDANKGSGEAVKSSVINEKSANGIIEGEDVTKESNAQGRPAKESFPLQFSTRNDYKEKLKAKLAKSFNSQELSELWDAVNRRKPLCRVIETSQRSMSFPTNELGSSYMMQHADLGRKLTATGDKDEKLKILRGFFFWLEHASMSGSFKPWLENDKDEECIELAGPDCEVLGVRINLDELHQEGNNEQDSQQNSKRQNAKESSSSQPTFHFNWNEEDVKPVIEEKWVKRGKSSCGNTQIHVKEEQETE